jgi:outer membrane protein assembly factor BamB
MTGTQVRTAASVGLLLGGVVTAVAGLFQPTTTDGRHEPGLLGVLTAAAVAVLVVGAVGAVRTGALRPARRWTVVGVVTAAGLGAGAVAASLVATGFPGPAAPLVTGGLLAAALGVALWSPAGARSVPVLGAGALLAAGVAALLVLAVVPVVAGLPVSVVTAVRAGSTDLPPDVEQVAWTRTVGNGMVPLVVDAGALVVDGDVVRALDGTTGEDVWSAGLAGAVVRAVAVSDDGSRVVVDWAAGPGWSDEEPERGDLRRWVLDGADGRLLADRPVSQRRTPLLTADVAVVRDAVEVDGTGLERVDDLLTGETLWTRSEPADCRPAGFEDLAAVDGVVVLASSCRPADDPADEQPTGTRLLVRGLDARSGEERWSWETEVAFLGELEDPSAVPGRDVELETVDGVVVATWTPPSTDEDFLADDAVALTATDGTELTRGEDLAYRRGLVPGGWWDLERGEVTVASFDGAPALVADDDCGLRQDASGGLADVAVLADVGLVLCGPARDGEAPYVLRVDPGGGVAGRIEDAGPVGQTETLVVVPGAVLVVRGEVLGDQLAVDGPIIITALVP